MKRIVLLVTFLMVGGILFAQKTADSCVIVAPTKIGKEGCGDQQVHVQLTSECAIRNLEITIFNRWGEKLHVSNQLDYSVSGKIINEGTYYYIIEGTFSNGTKINQNGFFMISVSP
nr:gliding motility-associated C-terminal domain-containing protein [uncultured Fluviicola sp.]